MCSKHSQQRRGCPCLVLVVCPLLFINHFQKTLGSTQLIDLSSNLGSNNLKTSFHWCFCAKQIMVTHSLMFSMRNVIAPWKTQQFSNTKVVLLRSSIWSFHPFWILSEWKAMVHWFSSWRRLTQKMQWNLNENRFVSHTCSLTAAEWCCGSGSPLSTFRVTCIESNNALSSRAFQIKLRRLLLNQQTILSWRSR